ncbi:hypothetical protein INT48_000376 [Thamnidium elegans]|uniref:PP2A regulatory subunit B'' EF-hand domain-containing protein n=1 Tax=Thamnidium elegans TaxID=101142 RepID=A0A8H7SS06_9FUNG|nr:hypothetical protein INT48_000376 [Thamnidium elegans]
MSTQFTQFYFPNKSLSNQHMISKLNHEIILDKVSSLFTNVDYLTQVEFHAVTEICSLPSNWTFLTKDYDYNDTDSLIYYILKKPEFNCITPDDFLPVLEDIVLNHPALQFLENNITFQERYIETVICRIFYDAHCPTGKLSLKQFHKSDFASVLRSLDPSIDLYAIHNVFSYKQFYVLYCKLWALDTDHDLALTETDLNNYNMGTLTGLTIERIMENGRIMAFTDTPRVIISDHDSAQDHPAPYLTYFDFIWFFLSEVDKNVDGDEVLSAYELSKFWQDQDTKQNFFGNPQVDGTIQFEDIIRQMNDLIQPRIPGQFSLKDLKKNGYLAERFFDTFINYDRFQVHEAHQEGSVREQKMYEQENDEDSLYEPIVLRDDLGFPVLCNWTDYADIEYNRIISEENYVNSLDEQDDILCREEYEEPQEYEENDEISHSSDDGLSDSLSVTSSNSFRSEIQTPDLHDPDYINSTVPESSEPEKQDTEDETCERTLSHPTSYNSKTKYYENTQEHTTLDCLHQHITN